MYVSLAISGLVAILWLVAALVHVVVFWSGKSSEQYVSLMRRMVNDLGRPIAVCALLAISLLWPITGPVMWLRRKRNTA